jgi:hypothetical protein
MKNKFASNSFSNSVRAAETHKMLKEAFGDNALGLTQTYKLFKCFKKG